MSNAKKWQKSTYSGSGDGNNCLELRTARPHIHLRESDAPAQELHTTPTALTHLLRTLKRRDL